MDYLNEFGIRYVALDFINQDHEKAANFIFNINKTILEADHNPLYKESIFALLQTLIEHKLEHFKREESSMLSVEFPALPIHKEEHSRVINELRALLDHWTHYQDITSLKTYMNEIFPQWLKDHTATMDHASAEYITSRRAIR